MDIDVLLFGPQAALAQADRVSVNVGSKDVTVGDILAGLSVAAPQLKASLKASRLAVNHAYATETDIITSKDEVALIGMVSGG